MTLPLTKISVVNEGRTWIGTRFAHQGKLKGVGVDCAGLIEMIPKNLGHFLDMVIPANYSSNPNPDLMRRVLCQHLDIVSFKTIQLGDIIWFRIDRDPQHLGIVSSFTPELTMIHAHQRKEVNRVIEQPLGRFWMDRRVGCFRYRGIE